MPSSSRWLALSTCIACFSQSIHVAADHVRWPYNLPADVRYFPEDEPLVRRSEEAQQRLQSEHIVGVKKMSLDEGEMFFPDYWTFASEQQDSYIGTVETPIRRRSDQTVDRDEYGHNNTIGQPAWPPFPLHLDEQIPRINPLLARFVPSKLRNPFEKRFQCPADTTSCATINRPNSCCANGETCQVIQDTGLGDVGCCAAGETCAGSLSGCQEGYSSCPYNPGGGCCIPGYACYDVGCAISSTATVLITTAVSQPSTTNTLDPVTSTSTTTVIVEPSTTAAYSSLSSSSSSSSSSIPSPSTSTHSTTAIVVVPTTTTSVRTAATLTCSTGYRSCPAASGGGCCPTDRACGSSAGCPPLSSTNSIIPPVRPTTDQATTSATTQSTSKPSTSDPYSGCPTGFYACSAYYQGGCCRVGRDCSKTTCPASASTTLIDTRSLTIAAPTGSGISATIEGLTGSCPTGWALCPTAAGGGCCPSGYGCGTTCSVRAGATQTGYGTQVAKLQPSSDAASICGTMEARRLVAWMSLASILFLSI